MARRFVRYVLRFLERLCFLVGGALALWCLVVIVRAEYYARMPIPPPPPPPAAVGVLPGEEDDASAGLRIPPQRPPDHDPGSWVARLEAPSVDLTATVLEGSGDGILSRAAGHIENTAFPGEEGNIGIAGHRDTVFRPLRR